MAGTTRFLVAFPPPSNVFFHCNKLADVFLFFFVCVLPTARAVTVMKRRTERLVPGRVEAAVSGPLQRELDGTSCLDQT